MMQARAKKRLKSHRDPIEEAADEARRHGLPEVARRPERDDAGGADLAEGRPTGRSSGHWRLEYPSRHRQAHRLHEALQQMQLKSDALMRGDESQVPGHACDVGGGEAPHNIAKDDDRPPPNTI